MLSMNLRWCALLCVVGCASSASSGPKVGTLTGTVDNTNGAPIGAGVTVTATKDDTKMTYVGVTAADGTFKIPDVPVGSGVITLGTLPTGCSVPPALAYTTVNNGGTKIIDLIVMCGP
jgi:hypothetical protein